MKKKKKKPKKKKKKKKVKNQKKFMTYQNSVNSGSLIEKYIVPSGSTLSNQGYFKTTKQDYLLTPDRQILLKDKDRFTFSYAPKFILSGDRYHIQNALGVYSSPSGSETSFSTTALASALSIPLNENFDLAVSNVVASDINETNELAGAKSLFVPITLTSNATDRSPVIDLGRASFIAVANRINNIDSSSDVFPTTDYRDSTQPDGDQNAFIYMTKKVALENPATAIKLIFSAHRRNSAELKALFRTLRSDDASDFDELGYQFFNTTGTTDVETLLMYNFTTNEQLILWIAFFTSFMVKIPMWPFHTWLPDAHVEAPTAGSVILAGVLLKMAGYGFIRFSIGFFPDASEFFAPFIFSLSVIAIIVTSLIALVQEDMKKLS